MNKNENFEQHENQETKLFVFFVVKKNIIFSRFFRLEDVRIDDLLLFERELKIFQSLLIVSRIFKLLHATFCHLFNIHQRSSVQISQISFEDNIKISFVMNSFNSQIFQFSSVIQLFEKNSSSITIERRSIVSNSKTNWMKIKSKLEIDLRCDILQFEKLTENQASDFVMTVIEDSNININDFLYKRTIIKVWSNSTI